MSERQRGQDQDNGRDRIGEFVGQAGVNTVRGLFDLPQVERALKATPKMRFAARRIMGAPGLVLDAANLLTAENKKRAAAEAVGGFLGGLAGSAVGGGIAAPVTGTVGAAAGSWAGGHLYDAVEDLLTPDEIENRRKIAETKRFNDARNAAR